MQEVAELLEKSPSNQDWNVQPLKQDGESKVFSADDVIDAYFQGKKAQLNQETQLKIEKLQGNLANAEKLSENIFSYIKENKFECNKVFLKIKDIYSFTAFFLIKEDDYCDDNFLKVYEKTIHIKKEVNTTSTFDFTTILTPNSEHFDNNALLSDGYILSYVGQR